MPTTFNKIDELNQTLKALLPMKPEWQSNLDKKFHLEFNYNSNHLEGNTLTYGETELLLIFGKTTGNHDVREYEEMQAHNVALQLIKDWSEEKERTLNETRIKNLNETILVKPFWKEAITSDGQQTRRLIKVGDYKEFPNSVRLSTGEIFEYASVADTPIMMGELIGWFRDAEEKKELHPVELAALLHYRFVRIHPFDDGNGRTARLLMNYVFLKSDIPLVVIKSADKRNYITALNQADTGNLNAFIEYIADQLVWSLQVSIKAAKGEDIEEAGDLQKEISLVNKQLDSKGMQKSKHPAIVYEIFRRFSNEIWSAIRQSLSQFDSLFSENKESHFVNHFPESFEKKNLFESPLLKSTGPQKIKIFGKDIYEDDINEIEWRQTLYGLKGVNDKPDMMAKAILLFKTDKYFVTVKLDYTTVIEMQYRYGDFMLQSDVEKMQILLAKEVLSEVKQRTQTRE